MESLRIYIVVPRTVTAEDGKNVTMSCGRMAAHAAHAAGRLGRDGEAVDELDLIVLAVSTSEELLDIRSKLVVSSVDFIEYRDLDHSFFGNLLTAIALYPIPKGSCAALNELRPWRCACNE